MNDNECLNELNNRIKNEATPVYAKIDKILEEKGYITYNEYADILNNIFGNPIFHKSYEGNNIGFTENPFKMERS